ncbi:MAG: response regulator [Candidatus Latescibacteria bacterium]|nr:response regulator [Candidatus Latescibacterota bacterium]
MAEATKKILVVDDEPDAVEFVTEILSDLEGVSVISAADGVEGLEKAKTEGPDLIVLDVQMPKKDGFSMFSDLKQDPVTKDISVIMLTGVTARMGLKFSAEDMGEYMGAEPEAYIEKPIDPGALLQAAKKILGMG